MTPTVPRDLTASVRDRLERAARDRGEDFQITLIRYANERLLYRLSSTPHARRFVLKGAMLFEVWGAHAHRATRDLDLLGIGSVDESWLREVMAHLCAVSVQPDGLAFDLSSLRIARIHEEQAYEGWQLKLIARLARVQIPLQLDIAFGQAVDPAPEEVEYPGLLGFPRATLLAYPREVTIAEKFHAMVALGITNGRLKDYFDIAYLADTFNFDSARLTAALRATFARRQTALPDQLPVGLAKDYFSDADRLRDWSAFARRAGVAESAGALPTTCDHIAAFIMPAVEWARTGATAPRVWRPISGWSE